LDGQIVVVELLEDDGDLEVYRGGRGDLRDQRVDRFLQILWSELAVRARPAVDVLRGCGVAVAATCRNSEC